MKEAFIDCLSDCLKHSSSLECPSLNLLIMVTRWESSLNNCYSFVNLIGARCFLYGLTRESKNSSSLFALVSDGRVGAGAFVFLCDSPRAIPPEIL